MPFAFYISHTLATKNKLEKAMLELLKKQDRKLLMSEIEATKFRDDLLAWTNALNAAHPKCKPIDPQWYDGERIFGHRDFYLHNTRVANCCLLEIKP